MTMKHITKHCIEIEEVISMTCDICQTKYDDSIEMQGFVSLQKTGSYGSIFGDGNFVECDICRACK